MDFNALRLKIQDAIALDNALVPAESAHTALLAAMRLALQNDSVAADEGDVSLAAAARAAIPRVEAGIKAAHERLVAQANAACPWVLEPLKWDADLLGPAGKGRSELLHTQYIAYFLDPRGSHGLGTKPLRELFRLLGRLIEGEDVFERLAKAPGEMDLLSRVRVSAEERLEEDVTVGQRRCDIWIELIDADRSVFVVIENKIDAQEHGDQLAAYEEVVWQRARERRVLNFEAKLVYLTPTGRQPDSARDQRLWLPVSYAQLAGVFMLACKDSPAPTATFVALYVNTILRHILMASGSNNKGGALRQLGYLREALLQGEHA